ncbi:peptidylprolyl isomerase [Desulfococcaceae bacterium OttesenSCG-928-F15]|nr:peptidylprolyl isomerase [Desulfococcaceae bacterium OttesenSCG-928-F15]
MQKAKKGDQVAVHYTGTFLDGEVFDSSRGRDPLGFELGGGQMIAGFDAAVLGMAVGETKTVTLAPEEAYGAHQPSLVQVCGRNMFPADMELKVDMVFQARLENNQMIPVRISDIQGETVTIDANPPMAGKTLVFEIELVTIG